MDAAQINRQLLVDEDPHIVVTDEVEGVGIALAIEEPIADFARETEIVHTIGPVGIHVMRPGRTRVVVRRNRREVAFGQRREEIVVDREKQGIAVDFVDHEGRGVVSAAGVALEQGVTQGQVRVAVGLAINKCAGLGVAIRVR